jgi:hypothetical protein
MSQLQGPITATLTQAVLRAYEARHKDSTEQRYTARIEQLKQQGLPITLDGLLAWMAERLPPVGTATVGQVVAAVRDHQRKRGVVWTTADEIILKGVRAGHQRLVTNQLQTNKPYGTWSHERMLLLVDYLKSADNTEPEWKTLAIVTCWSFATRGGEFSEIRRNQIRNNNGYLVLTIPKSKNGQNPKVANESHQALNHFRHMVDAVLAQHSADSHERLFPDWCPTDINKILVRAATFIGLDPKLQFTCHALRFGACFTALRALGPFAAMEASLEAVKRLSGHRCIEMARLYSTSDEQRLDQQEHDRRRGLDRAQAAAVPTAVRRERDVVAAADNGAAPAVSQQRAYRMPDFRELLLRSIEPKTRVDDGAEQEIVATTQKRKYTKRTPKQAIQKIIKKKPAAKKSSAKKRVAPKKKAKALKLKKNVGKRNR